MAQLTDGKLPLLLNSVVRKQPSFLGESRTLATSLPFSNSGRRIPRTAISGKLAAVETHMLSSGDKLSLKKEQF